MDRIRNNLTVSFMFATVIIIVLAMGVKFWWDYKENHEQALHELLEKAQVITKQQIAMWEFMIINQDRINYDNEGNFHFKHLNCSTVSMGVGVIFAEMTNYTIKPTNIVYRNEINAPDPFELSALLSFKENPEMIEYYKVDETAEGNKVFRYMTSLTMDEACLTCHGGPEGEEDVSGYPKEGYQLGDFGGAISLVMPMDIHLQNIQKNIISNAIFFIVLMVLCITSIYILVRKLVTRPLSHLEKAVSQVGSGNLDVDTSDIKARGELKKLTHHFQEMADQLRDLYNNLEHKVEIRTLELEEANRKLKEVNNFKSEFLAIMSHELRTPLTSVIAFTELLLTDSDLDQETARHHLEEIRMSSQHLLGLINNILDMAKIEAGKNQLMLEMMDIADVIAAVEGMVIPIAANKGIHMVVQVHSDIPLMKGDPEKIRRVVENLVGNAIKFTGQEGIVKIIAFYDVEQQMVIIRVKDNGIGIKEEKQKDIFEKFTQSDSSISRKYGGTGLGLALAKEIVEMHSGSIQMESVFNEGTTITVALPIGVTELGGYDSE